MIEVATFTALEVEKFKKIAASCFKCWYCLKVFVLGDSPEEPDIPGFCPYCGTPGKEI